jgi:hypothetical protein
MKDSFTKFAQRFSKQNIIFLPTLGIILTAQYDDVLQQTSKWWAIYVEEVYAQSFMIQHCVEDSPKK